MTTRREVPLTGDTLAWVHSELSDIKARLSIVQQAAEQSRALATDASEKAHSIRTKADQLDNHAVALFQFQEELRLMRDQLLRAHDDISSLRQTRDEAERRAIADSDRQLQDRNEIGKRFGELQKQIDAWQDRVTSFEEQNRRNLETASQLTMRLEALENDKDDMDVRQARVQAALSRVDQDINRLSSTISPLQREDEVNRERVASLAEMLRRVEADLDAVKAQTSRVDRMHDRVELIQAERTRHGERLNELTLAMEEVKTAFNEQAERLTLAETKMSTYLAELKKVDERMTSTREQIAMHVRSIADLQADFRKRQIAALEKESRELRSHGISFAEE